MSASIVNRSVLPSVAPASGLAGFTTDEAAEYLNDKMGLALTADNIATLEVRIAGWIAALQLAELSRGCCLSFPCSSVRRCDLLGEEGRICPDPTQQRGAPGVLPGQPEHVETG